MIKNFISIAICAALLPAGADGFQSRPLVDKTVICPEFQKRKSPFPNLVTVRTLKRPRIALVLSGGGARGISAVGILKSFEKNKIPIDLLIGTSMGSIIGGLYASGYSTDQLQALVASTDWNDLLSYSDENRREDMFLDQKIARDRSVLILRFQGFEPIIPSAFSTGQRLNNYINKLTLQGIFHPNPSFDDLRIPFRTVATDLVSGKRIVIDRGDLTSALRASIAVPLLFTSFSKDSMQLLDGGLVGNLPVDVAVDEKADIIIASDMTSVLRPRDQINKPWEMIDQITTIMMQEVNEISKKKANIIITPALGNHLSSDFTHLDSLIAIGEEAADSVMPDIKHLMAQRSGTDSRTEDSIHYNHPKFSITGELRTPMYADTLKAIEQKRTVTYKEILRFLSDLYTTGDYSTTKARVHEFKDSSLIELQLTPFPVLRDVFFIGNQLIPIDTLKEIFHPLLGKQINSEETSKALEAVLLKYRDDGYSLAKIVAAQYDSISSTATITIDEGIIYRIDIIGTRKTRDWVVRRELPFNRHEVFDVKKVSQGISNLYATNLFEQVVITVHHEGDKGELNVVTVQARDRSAQLIRFGLRADNERNIQPSLDVRDENFLGAGAEIGFMAGGGPRNQSYIGEIKATRIFNSYFTMGIKGYAIVTDMNADSNVTLNDPVHFKRERKGEFREMRNGSTVSFGTQLGRLGNFTIEGRLDHLQVFNIYNQPIDNQQYDISAIRVGTEIDTQDKFPFPRRGMLADVYYESANVSLGGKIGYTKFYFSYENYQTFFGSHTLHPKFVLGVGDESLPISEQYSLGGQQNFFGFNEDDKIGRQLIVGSLEYRYKMPISIFFDTYLKIRYDLGSIWLKPEEVRLADFTHAIGASLALDTPIGPAEFSISRAFYLRMDIFDHPVSWGPYFLSFSIGYPIAGMK